MPVQFYYFIPFVSSEVNFSSLYDSDPYKREMIINFLGILYLEKITVCLTHTCKCR